MRIAYLSNSMIPSKRANSVHVMKMCQAFARSGHEVTLYGVKGGGTASPFEWYGVEQCFEIEYCKRPRLRGWSTLSFALETARRVRRRPCPDLIYSRNAPGLVRLAGLDVPMIYEAHALPAHPIRRHLERWIFTRPKLRHVVVISDALRRDYEDAFPRLAGRIVVAHDGADLPSKDTAPQSEWPGRVGALQVGYVGNLYAGRGIELILSLAARMPQIDFHLIGGSDAEVSEWRARMPPANVRFHGHLPHAALGACYAAFDVLLAPYQRQVGEPGGRQDTARWMSPLKLFEYMAAGKAIIASDLPVLREVLKPMKNAVLAPPDNVDPWHEALERLNVDPTHRSALAAAAYDDLVAHFTWDKRAEKVIRPLLDSR